MTFFKLVLIILGTLSLFIGTVGIFVPGLPTTVFLLITAGLYGRSSDRLYNKLIKHRYLGPYILNFQEKKGMTFKSKLWAIITMWLMISVSSIFFVNVVLVRLIIISLGIIGTLVIGLFVKTVK